MSIIALITDFGSRDWFVGSMKGVILGIHPRATIVDITHEIPPGDVRAAAFALFSSCAAFPRQTCFVAVVDPGVGGPRAAIAAKSSRYTFIGPDNGALSFALGREEKVAIRQLTNSRYFRQPVSRTFHGRDVFAPAAAHLARGVSFPSLGRAQKGYVQLPWPEAKFSGRKLRGEIVYVDRFGNAITNLDGQTLARLEREASRVRIRGKIAAPIRDFYQAVPLKKTLALIGSSGFLEIAVNGGSAAALLALKTGDEVEVFGES